MLYENIPFFIVARQVFGGFEAQETHKLLFFFINFLLLIIVSCFNVHFNNKILRFADN